jgi:hypothetical protein
MLRLLCCVQEVIQEVKTSSGAATVKDLFIAAEEDSVLATTLNAVATESPRLLR